MMPLNNSHVLARCQKSFLWMAPAAIASGNQQVK
jgi:hypothetical protein